MAEPSNQSSASFRNTKDMAGKYLSFVLDKCEYGVGILLVREIIAIQEITPLPQVPDFVLGVINLRGRIIPVVDMRVRLGIACAEFDNETCIIVVEVANDSGENSLIGFVVDSVREVLDIPEQALERPPNVSNDAGSSWITGLAKLTAQKKVVTLLDVQAILSHVGSAAAQVENAAA